MKRGTSTDKKTTYEGREAKRQRSRNEVPTKQNEVPKQPEKKSMDVYPLEEILEIYTPEDSKSGFMGNLDGDAWFALVGRSREVYNWKHALRNILNGTGVE